MPEKTEGQNGKSVSFPVALLLGLFLGACGWAFKDRILLERDTTKAETTATVEIANIKEQLKVNKEDFGKRMDSLEAKFEELRKEVMRSRPVEREVVGKPRPVN